MSQSRQPGLINGGLVDRGHALVNGGILRVGGAESGGSDPPLSPYDWWDPDLGAFQDTSGTTPATANNDPVAFLTGQTGSFGNLTNTGGTDRPLLKTASLNGHGTILFDGSNDVLKKVASLAHSNTFVAAVLMISWVDFGWLFGDTSGPNAGCFMRLSSPQIQGTDSGTSTLRTSALAVGTWGIVSIGYPTGAGNDIWIRVNNNARVSSLLHGGATGSISGFGLSGALEGVWANVQFGRSAIYHSALSLADENTVVGAFMSYYGIT